MEEIGNANGPKSAVPVLLWCLKPSVAHMLDKHQTSTTHAGWDEAGTFDRNDVASTFEAPPQGEHVSRVDVQTAVGWSVHNMTEHVMIVTKRPK